MTRIYVNAERRPPDRGETEKSVAAKLHKMNRRGGTATSASTTTAKTGARRKGLRAFLAATLFVVSALMQATIAPHAALSATQEFCVTSHPAADEKAPSRAPTHGWHAHCGACPIAAAPIISERPPIARLEQPPTPLVFFDAWPFEPRERRRPGEPRSRAPPTLS
jgi:hypothetical protein